jgi:hypothetical protein
MGNVFLSGFVESEKFMLVMIHEAANDVDFGLV